jgi:hypothetical protein
VIREPKNDSRPFIPPAFGGHVMLLDSRSWPGVGNDPGGMRYSRLDQIEGRNARPVVSRAQYFLKTHGVSEATEAG